MSARTRELAERRAELQRRCALQRQSFAREARSIEQRLRSVDRFALVMRRALAEPLVIVAMVAGAVFIGPMRILRLAGRALLVTAALRRVWRLLRH